MKTNICFFVFTTVFLSSFIHAASDSNALTLLTLPKDSLREIFKFLSVITQIDENELPKYDWARMRLVSKDFKNCIDSFVVENPGLAFECGVPYNWLTVTALQAPSSVRDAKKYKKLHLCVKPQKKQDYLVFMRGLDLVVFKNDVDSFLKTPVIVVPQFQNKLPQYFQGGYGSPNYHFAKAFGKILCSAGFNADEKKISLKFFDNINKKEAFIYVTLLEDNKAQFKFCNSEGNNQISLEYTQTTRDLNSLVSVDKRNQSPTDQNPGSTEKQCIVI